MRHRAGQSRSGNFPTEEKHPSGLRSPFTSPGRSQPADSSRRFSDVRFRTSSGRKFLSDQPFLASAASIRSSDYLNRLSAKGHRASDWSKDSSDSCNRGSDSAFPGSDLSIRSSDLWIRSSDLWIRSSDLPNFSSDLSIRVSDSSNPASDLMVFHEISRKTCNSVNLDNYFGRSATQPRGNNERQFNSPEDRKTGAFLKKTAPRPSTRKNSPKWAR
jgi:hypothetical protein